LGKPRSERGGAADDSARPVAEHAVVRVLAQSSTFADAALPLLEAIADTLDWRAGMIWEIDEDAGVLRCLEAWQAPDVDVDAFEEASKGISFAPGVGLPGRVWASGEPAWILKVTEDQNFPRAHSAEAAAAPSG
jgi:two-component system, cell cycle sensor histidine kinase and response regulator CckA